MLRKGILDSGRRKNIVCNKCRNVIFHTSEFHTREALLAPFCTYCKIYYLHILMFQKTTGTVVLGGTADFSYL